MSKVKISLKMEGDIRLISLTGIIDEDFEYQSLLENPGKFYKIDFNEIKMINSTGIREWIRFIEKLGPSVEFQYFNCPHIIIQQMNMVSGFLTKNAKVISFYAPYFCEETDEEEHILLQATDIKNFKAPVRTIEVDGHEVELDFDAIEDQYFKFLKR